MKLLLYGAGGHGKVVADIVSKNGNMELLGFVDDDSSKTGKQIGRFNVLGTSKRIPEFIAEGVRKVIVAIGDNEARLTKAAEMEQFGLELATAIHPAAVVASDVKIGAGTVVMAGVVINPSAGIGRNVIVNTGSTVDHDCVLEDGVHISPGVHLAGNVRVGKASHIGIGANIIPNITIGEYSIVGAGAVVLRDVPSRTTVVGNPARILSNGKR